MERVDRLRTEKEMNFKLHSQPTCSRVVRYGDVAVRSKFLWFLSKIYHADIWHLHVRKRRFNLVNEFENCCLEICKFMQTRQII